MRKRIQIAYSKEEVATVLSVLSKELQRQIQRQCLDPTLAKAVAKVATAREKSLYIPEGKE